MRKIETLFIGGCLIGAVVAISGAIWNYSSSAARNATVEYPETKFGAFLAARHALYQNDFDAAARFVAQVGDSEYAVVKNTQYLAEFLSGNMPENVVALRDEKNTAAQLIYDAYLVRNEDWTELYKRHKKDESALSAPLRIWASVATGHEKDALKFIEKLPTNDSWKSFVRGQIFVAADQADKAAAEFGKVHPEFLNINDYVYLMSFYQHYNMTEQAESLHIDFTSRPGGMFMLGGTNVPVFAVYDGFKNALAFSLVQNVSHTQVMMYSDLAILLLQFASVTAPEFAASNSDAINYYIGQYLFNNVGDYAAHFNRISVDSPFKLFATLRQTEQGDKTTARDIQQLRKALDKNPLFVSGATKMIAHHVKNGDKRRALRVANRALNHDDLTELGRAFFLKARAQVYFVFGDYDAAQSDIHDASVVLTMDSDIIALQAKIWAAQQRELDNAYDYAMGLVTARPTDIMAWDTLGYVVGIREGAELGLDVLARVGEVAASCSSLFMHMGDMYAEIGDNKAARDAYLRAIDLSDDGLIIVSEIEKKIRKLK